MPLTYVHVSDIHFGQETGSENDIHDDVKECLIVDVADAKREAGIERMDGVIVTGDVAFSGKKEQYDRAAQWLDQLTEVIGCEKTDVIVVPGNHDVDRDKITAGAGLTLEGIIKGGNEALDRVLEEEQDREILYAKFADYRDFAEGYSCGLKTDGGIAVNREVPVAPERSLRFVGLNSALLCTGQDGDDGRLLLGGRQWIVPRTDGEEVVVLCHHPIESLQDNEEASDFIRSRARVHIFGHVHEPSLAIESPEEGADLLTMSAGATVPPRVRGEYQYTYNLLTFDWDARTNGLRIEIVPRRWNKEATRFGPDRRHFGKERVERVLRCPNFKRQAISADVRAAGAVCRSESWGATATVALSDAAGGKEMERNSDLLRLHFFRDLSAEERVRALIEVGVLPEDWAIELTHTIEIRLLDQALGSGLHDKLETAVATLRSEEGNAAWGKEG